MHCSRADNGVLYYRLVSERTCAVPLISIYVTREIGLLLDTSARLRINDLLAQIVPKIEKWEDYPVTDADRDFVRNPCNSNHELTMAIVKHKNYILEEEDIKIYLAKGKSKFAQGVELNQGFKVALQKFNQ